MLAGTVTPCGVSPVCTVNLSVGNLLFFVACHFLAVISIVLHQPVGMPTGTGVMIPLFTSSQRAYLTSSLKWNGRGIGLCLALGTAPSFRWIWEAALDIGGNFPFFLKDLLAMCCNSHSLSQGIFCSVGGKGSFLGRVGSWSLTLLFGVSIQFLESACSW